MANFDAPFIVMALAPMVGRPYARRRLRVVCRRYSLDLALNDARYEQQRVPRTSYWIMRRGAKAHLPW